MSLLGWLNRDQEPETREDIVEPEVQVEESQFVTKAEHDQTLAILQGMQQSLQTLSQGFNVIAADRQQGQPKQAAIEDVTDEEIEEALRSGEGAAKFRKMVRAENAKQATEMNNTLAAGFNAVRGLTQEVLASKMPYYNRFQKEIDQYISALAPDAQLNPQSYKAAHDYVVGLHVTELINETTEATRRQANEPPKTGLSGAAGTGTTRTMRSGEQPQDFRFSQENESALQVKGYTPDLQAQKMGYKSWADYMEKTAAYV